MIIGITITSWHQNEVSLTIELIDSFVNSVETQVAQSMDKYEREKQNVFDEISFEKETFATVTEEHGGLRSDTWNLELIFKEYFPNLQRRSAFLTVWGYFEHELDKLCSLYKSEKGFALDLPDLSDKGIDRSTKYLEKVARLNMHKASEAWNRIRKIQTVRNVVAHRDGRLQNQRGELDSAAINSINGLQFVRTNGELILEEGFLGYVAAAFKSYFKLIGESIKTKETV